MPWRPKTHRSFTPAIKQHQARERESAHKRGYGKRWQKVRLGWLRAHPLCAECQRNGRVTPATDVDHVTPHKGDMALFWDSSNWQSLCQSCHSRKTASEDGGFGKPLKNQ